MLQHFDALFEAFNVTDPTSQTQPERQGEPHLPKPAHPLAEPRRGRSPGTAACAKWNGIFCASGSPRPSPQTVRPWWCAIIRSWQPVSWCARSSISPADPHPTALTPRVNQPSDEPPPPPRLATERWGERTTQATIQTQQKSLAAVFQLFRWEVEAVEGRSASATT